MAGIKRSTEDYKSSRPSEIIKLEHSVAKVVANEFLDPFDPTSGIPVNQGLADGILATKEREADLYNTFL